MNAFPRTTVAGVSLSRMIIGTNWILGWSHRSPATDQQIKNRFPGGVVGKKPPRICEMEGRPLPFHLLLSAQ